MSQAPSTSGLVRVTVASGTRRVDLVLPSAVPVAELVPELARSVGLLDGSTVHGGYHLISQDGRELSADAGLVAQGVEDGGLLTVTAGVDDPAPRVYDDVVEAMTDVVERDLTPWHPASGRRTSLIAAALLLAIGAGALLLNADGDSLVPAVSAAIIGLLLTVGGVVLSRTQREFEVGSAVGWMGAAYAAVAGLLVPTGEPFFHLPVLLAGLGAMVAGLIGLLGLSRARALAIPPIVVGALLVVAALVLRGTGIDPAVLFTVLAVVLVICGSVLPWLALSVTGTRSQTPSSPADLTPIDAEEVGQDARVAHEILLAVTATVGLVIVLATPLMVSLGKAGTALAVACALVVMLRTRQHRTGSEVATGLAAGTLGLAVTALSVLWLRPEWRGGTAVVLAAVAGALLLATLVPTTSSVRRSRLGDLLESVALLSLLPLLVVAVGLFDRITG